MNVLLGNAGELYTHLVEPAEDPLLAAKIISTIGDEFEPFMFETDRLLHNYVASAKSLVDHTRVLVRSYSDNEFESDYDRHKRPLVESPVNSFVGDLRDYTLHRSLLPLRAIGGSYDLMSENPGFDFDVCMDRDELLPWGRWRAGSTRFLESAQDHIPLLPMLKDHVGLLNDLYVWLFQQFEVLHEEEWSSYQAERDAIRLDFLGPVDFIREQSPGTTS